jgi:hypothetical protein
MDFKVQIFKAIRPEDITCQNHSNGFSSSHRNISCLENAISESHRRVRELALNTSSEWCVFLEEDFILENDFDSIKDLFLILNECFGRTRPLAIHLFPEQFGLLRRWKHQELLQIMKVPDYAVGYAMNHKALEVAGNIPIANQVADWPMGIRRLIDWYAPTKSIIAHPLFDSDSRVSLNRKFREIRSGRRSQFSKLFKIGNTQLILFFLGRIFRITYGSNKIESEKLRSVIICCQRN